MHRKCFWSNKMAREQGRLEGGKRVWLWVHVPLLPGGVSLDTECWASKAFFLAPRAGLLQQRLMVVLILLSHGSSVSPALLPYVAGQASKRAACLWCDITQWYAMRWEYVFFMNRELGWGNSCMPDQLARRAIVKFFPSPQLFLYGPLKWADASILLPSVASEDYSASLLISLLSLKVSHGL